MTTQTRDPLAESQQMEALASRQASVGASPEAFRTERVRSMRQLFSRQQASAPPAAPITRSSTDPTLIEQAPVAANEENRQLLENIATHLAAIEQSACGFLA